MKELENAIAEALALREQVTFEAYKRTLKQIMAEIIAIREALATLGISPEAMQAMVEKSRPKADRLVESGERSQAPPDIDPHLESVLRKARE